MEAAFLRYYSIDKSLCDRIIKYYEDPCTPRNVNKFWTGIHPDIKEPTDSRLEGPLKALYLENLQKCIDEYRKEYTFCDIIDTWGVCESVVVQRYLPGQFYKNWHCERDEGGGLIGQRVLVFMTYLNDVNDGGETEFYYQNLKVKPEKGKTLIWPAEWTHTHRGLNSNSETKYIVTGWLSFVNKGSFQILPSG